MGIHNAKEVRREGKRGKEKEKVNTLGHQDLSTKDSGSNAKCMDLESKILLTAANMRASLQIT